MYTPSAVIKGCKYDFVGVKCASFSCNDAKYAVPQRFTGELSLREPPCLSLLTNGPIYEY